MIFSFNILDVDWRSLEPIDVPLHYAGVQRQIGGLMNWWIRAWRLTHGEERAEHDLTIDIGGEG